MFRFFSPSNLFIYINKSIGIINTIIIPIIIVSVIFALIVSPEDYIQGDSVRIMYVHVPSAWLASILYFAMAGCATVFLIWKHPLADVSARCIAPVGLIFSLLTGQSYMLL